MTSGWRDRRNRLLASSRFQRFATRFLPTRPIARHHAQRLFDLVAGFTYSQTLLACVRLDLFAMLADGPLAVKEIAARAGLSEAAAMRLAKAAAALDLLELRREGQVALGALGAALRGNPGVMAMIEHHHALYADLADPVALLRGEGGGALARFWPYAGNSESGSADAIAGYSRLMAESQPLVADLVLDAYLVQRHNRLLDVGGGEGTFLAAAATRAPKLELGLFDLPAVVGQTPATVATVHGGDFLRDPLPRGYDLVTLIRILHDHDDAAAMTLLRNVRRALEPGGRLLIGEPMAGARGAERVGDTYFGLYLWAMGSGRARTVRELSAMLVEAGFSRVRHLSTAMPLTADCIVASA